MAAATASAAPTSEQAKLFGRPDEPLRRILATAKIENVSKGRGGRSLSFKLSFEGDVQGFFKPEQAFAANWYSELASYYLDRELGLGRVPPAVGRRLEWENLRYQAERDDRIDEVVVRDGTVRGSVAWWVPTPLEPIALPTGWESWLRIESATYPSPFESPEVYLEQRRADGRGPGPELAQKGPVDARGAFVSGVGEQIDDAHREHEGEGRAANASFAHRLSCPLLSATFKLLAATLAAPTLRELRHIDDPRLGIRH
jgi:hypothetical protein